MTTTPDTLPAVWREHYLERVAIMAENGAVTAEIEAFALRDTLEAMRRDATATTRRETA